MRTSFVSLPGEAGVYLQHQLTHQAVSRADHLDCFIYVI